MSYKEETYGDGYGAVARELKHRNDMLLHDDGWEHVGDKWISPGGTPYSRTEAVNKMRKKRKRALKQEA